VFTTRTWKGRLTIRLLLLFCLLPPAGATQYTLFNSKAEEKPGRTLDDASARAADGLRLSITTLRVEGNQLVMTVCLRFIPNKLGMIDRSKWGFGRVWLYLDVAFWDAHVNIVPGEFRAELLHKLDFLYHEASEETCILRVPFPANAHSFSLQLGERLATRPIHLSASYD
jgi:hypothetical protein